MPFCCHSRESGNLAKNFKDWIPAFAGMTTLLVLYRYAKVSNP